MLSQFLDLGAERHPLLDRRQTHFEGVNALLKALDAGTNRRELVAESIELFVHVIEAGVHLVAQLANLVT